MKLEINGIAVPYGGGCTIEENYPFFEDNGLENSFSYSFKIPICAITKQIFKNAERINTNFDYEERYYLKLSHLGKVYVAGESEIIDISETDYEVFIADTGSSIYSKLKNLNLKDLNLDSFTFDNKEAYIAFAKERIHSNMKDSKIVFPLMGATKFFENTEYDDVSTELVTYKISPVLNSWDDRYERQTEYPKNHVTLFPCIPIHYIIDKISEKLEISLNYTEQTEDVVIPDHMRGKTLNQILETGAWRDVNGKIVVNIADFIPEITALEFFEYIIQNSCVFQKNQETITFRNQALILPVNQLDITPYVISKTQAPIKEIKGWTLQQKDCEILAASEIPAGNEIEIEFNYEKVTEKTWLDELVKNDITVGDDGAVGHDPEDPGDEYTQVFRTFNSINDFELKETYKDLVITKIHHETPEEYYPVNITDVKQEWVDYLNWKIKAKRKVTVKCTPNEKLFARNTSQFGCVYQNKEFLIEQVRYELGKNKIGTVTYILQER